MATDRDYYDVLGVSRKASTDEIRRAYRSLARKFHPDMNKAEDAAAKFNEVQQAYDVLSDDEKRRAYDQFGHAGIGSAGAARGSASDGRGGTTYTWTNAGGGFNPDDLSSVFDQFFGAGRSSSGQTRARPRPHEPATKGENLRRTLELSFMTAVMGGSEQLRVHDADGNVEVVDVTIPAGVDDGAKLRLRGRGQPGSRGGAPGDLLLTVKVGRHPLFRRDGLDILIDLPITIAEAVSGTVVKVPLLSGSAQLKVPPGTSSGQKLRLRGQGVRTGSGKLGDYYAVVQIVAPEELSDSDRATIMDLAERLPNPRRGAHWDTL